MRRFTSFLLAALALAWAPAASSRQAESLGSGRQAAVAFEGRLVLRVDDGAFDRPARSHWYVVDDGGTSRRLQVDAKHRRLLSAGRRVRIVGQAAGDTVTVGPDGSLSLLAQPAGAIAGGPPPITGERSVAVMLVNFADAPVNPHCTVAAMAGSYFTGTYSVNAFYQEASFGQLSLAADANADGAPDVFGPFTVTTPATGTCEGGVLGEVADQADRALEDAGVNLAAFQHRLYVLPDEANCGNWGEVGCESGQCRAWVEALPASFGTCTVHLHAEIHEIGHNLGMHHAALDADDDGVIDEFGEYGDRSDVMGACCLGEFQPNAPHKFELGWFAADPTAVVEHRLDGTRHAYTLAALELDPPSVQPPQAVRVGGELFLSTRARIGWDANIDVWSDVVDDSQLFPGHTSVHRTMGAHAHTLLLATMADGQTFHDPASGVTVRQLAHTDSSVSLEVVDPVLVSIAGDATREGAAGAGGRLRFRVSLSRPAEAALQVRVKTVAGTATADADFLARRQVLRFAPGERERVFSVTVLGDAVAERTERLTAVLSAPVGARLGSRRAVGQIRDDD